MDHLHFSFKKIFSTIFLLLVLFSTGTFADELKGILKGNIVTTKNEPAENVSVTLKGTSYGSITDENGKYEFRAPVGDYILVISHTGLKSQELSVTVKASGATVVPVITVDIALSSLKEVVVNGNKTNKFVRKKSDDVAKMPLDNLENPQSYTSISKDLLQEQAIFSSDNAVKNSSGITTLWTPTGRVGDGGSYYTLRGFPVQALLRNGLSGNITGTIDAANLETLEIIKGPSGTLYGSSLTSYGGLINRVTKKPFDGTAGEVTFSAGSYNFSRVSADFNTPLDSAKKALFRLNTAYTNSSSFQDNGFNKNFAFDPSFSYKVNDRLTLSFDAEISHGTATTPPIFYFGSTIAALGVSNANKLNINYKNFYESNDLVTTSDNVNFFGQAAYKISDSWKSQTAISSTNSSSSGYGPYFYLLAGNNSIARDVWAIDGRSNTLQIQQNFTGDFKIGGLRNRLVAGIDYLNQSAAIKYSDPNGGTDSFDVLNITGAMPTYNNFNKAKVDSLFQNTPVSTSYSRYNTNTYSVYASDVLNITDNLLAMASLRVDYFRTSPIYTAATNTRTTPFNQTTLSPKFGLVYQLVKNEVSLFGNYMNGFSNPGYNLVYDATTSTNVTRLFKSEEANQLEGGVKLDLFDGKLTSTISYYDISVKNKVRADPNHANASLQDGTQSSKGFEAEIIANPFTGFNVLLGYSYNNSLMTKSSVSYDNGRRPQTAGPANSANFWLSYALTQGSAKGLGIGFGGNYAGNNQVINNAYNGVFTLPEYYVFNSGIFLNKEKFRLSLNVSNLTNKEYWVGYTTVDPQMLRQVIGSVTYRF